MDTARFAVMCQYHYNVVRALDVPAACFNPPSQVDSSFMVLERLENAFTWTGETRLSLRALSAAPLPCAARHCSTTSFPALRQIREQAASYL